eukprot:TRINITY_DN12194_c0_g1_i1.p1 TRINITY_DN12194_c0_g1~~TRINITY_DN12194_c0_g1_i1.p1  ORF type:complete len:236 (+),score=31.68 TRINITY_DN12194_c0_g1_i1:58-765(+)
MSRYFSGEKEVTCHICGGSHARRECPNRICFTCFGIGHQRCDKKGSKGCWGCLGYHTDGNCSAEIFSGEGSSFEKNKTKLCIDCESTRHLSCTGLLTPKGATAPEVQCTLCCTMGHTAYDCRKPGYISSLIKQLRSAGSETRDPRFGLHSQPTELHQSLPIVDASDFFSSIQKSSGTSGHSRGQRFDEPQAHPPTSSGGRSEAAKQRRSQKAKKKKEKKEKRKASEKKPKKKAKS